MVWRGFEEQKQASTNKDARLFPTKSEEKQETGAKFPWKYCQDKMNDSMGVLRTRNLLNIPLGTREYRQNKEKHK